MHLLVENGRQNGRQNGREISWQEWQVWQMGSVADGRVKHMGKIGKRRQNKQWDSETRLSPTQPERLLHRLASLGEYGECGVDRRLRGLVDRREVGARTT